MIGEKLDSRYEIIELIGSGGMANVYKALDSATGQMVAVKVLKEDKADDESKMAFLYEARADAKLNHKNIVDIIDVGVENNKYYMVMEYVDGKSLKDLIDQRKTIDPMTTIKICIQIAQGLNSAHKRGITHRDIKPHNILMTSQLVPKIADFGIATIDEKKLKKHTHISQTSTDEIYGSVQYISPEQAKGAQTDERSDLYSLGITMYEMLTGTVPYDATNPVGIALMHVQNNVPSPQNKVPDIPDGLSQIVLNLTRRNPLDRYQNAEQLLSDLRILEKNIESFIQPTYDELHSAYYEPKKSFVERFKDTFNRNKKVIVPVLLGLVGVCTVFAVIFHLTFTTVPDVQGKSLTEAITILTDLDLEYAIESRQYDPSVPSEHIITQSIQSDTRVKKKTIVYLTVSNGAQIVNVPDLIGKTLEESMSILKAGGFKVDELLYEYDDVQPQNYVCKQSPQSYTKAEYGSTITLTVSLGKEQIVVPKLTGLTLDEAKSKLKKTGLSIGVVTYMSSPTVEAGKIIEQIPAAFTSIDKGSQIDIVISTGVSSTKTFSINLKDFYHGNKTNPLIEVYLCDANGKNPSLEYKATHAKTDTVTFKLTGSQTMIYKVYADGELIQEVEAEF